MESQKSIQESITRLTESQQQKPKTLDQVLLSLKENPSDEKFDLVCKFVIELAGLEGDYKSQKSQIQLDIRQFIKLSLNNNFNSHLTKYNISQFDQDNIKGYDQQETKIFGDTIGKAIKQIIDLGGLNNFSKIVFEEKSKNGFSNADKYLADKVNGSSYAEIGMKKLIGETKGGYVKDLIGLPTSYWEEISQHNFDLTSQKSRDEMLKLLIRDFGEGALDVFKLVLNVLSGVILIPRYTYYRTMTSDDNLNKVGNGSKTEYEIKLDELVEQNPSLQLLELMGEKGIQLLKKLAEMLTSGKQGDLSNLLVSIAGLLAGGAGLVKFGLNFARKSAVKSARLAGRETRLAGETTTREIRNTIRSGANYAGKAQRFLSNVDDIVGGAGIGHMTSALGLHGAQSINDEKFSKNYHKSKITDSIPESLKSQDPLAWIDKNGEISYNKGKIENKFGVKITIGNKGETLFDGKSLKDHEKSREILQYLKILKSHEVTHRILEARGIKEIKLGTKILSQEDICSIVDGSKKLSEIELKGLEKELKKMLGKDFEMLKNGEINQDFLRRYDSKEVSKARKSNKGDFKREKEAAMSGNHNLTIDFNENFFLSWDKIDGKFNMEGLDFLEGKEISLPELLFFYYKKHGNITDIGSLKSELDIFEITTKLLDEENLMQFLEKGYNEVKFRELLKNPEKISSGEILYFANISKDKFNTLLEALLSKGNNNDIIDLLTKIIDRGEIIYSSLSPKSLRSILNSTKVDKKGMGLFLSSICNSSISKDLAIILKDFLESKGNTLGLSEALLSTLKSNLLFIIDKFNPNTIIDGYLKGNNIDFNKSQLSTNTPARTVWNNRFDNSDLLSKLNLILRGEPSFFHPINLDNFFNLNFYSLSSEQKSSLYNLVKEGGKYYDYIKDYRNYNKILEEAKDAYDKLKGSNKREQESIYKG